MYFLMTRVMGYTEESEDQAGRRRTDPRFHKWLCSELEKPLSTLYLLPRDHTKSTTGGVVRTVQRVLKVKNISIMLGSRTLGRTKALLAEIQAHLASEKLTFLFPDMLYPDPGRASKQGLTKWTDEQIVVKRSRTSSNPTVWVTGIGKTITGFHPDEIVLDDIIDQDTVATETQGNKVEQWWTYLQPIASVSCIFSIFGTFYDDLDLYHKLEKQATKHDIKLRVIKRQVEKDGKFIYRYFDQEVLEQKRKDCGNDVVFYNQYYNLTRTDVEKVFRGKYKDYQKLELPLSAYERIMTVDPGFTKTRTADNTGICVCCYDPLNMVWVDLAKRYKLTVIELLDKIYELDKIYNFTYIGIESGAWQDAIQDMFNYIITTEDRKTLPIYPLKTPNITDAKYRRIVGTAGYLDRGIVRLKTDPKDEDSGPTSDLTTEMYYFSSNSRQHDDVLDAFSMQSLIHIWGDITEETEEKELSPEDWQAQWVKRHDTYGNAIKRKNRTTRSWTDF